MPRLTLIYPLDPSEGLNQPEQTTMSTTTRICSRPTPETQAYWDGLNRRLCCNAAVCCRLFYRRLPAALDCHSRNVESFQASGGDRSIACDQYTPHADLIQKSPIIVGLSWMKGPRLMTNLIDARRQRDVQSRCDSSRGSGDLALSRRQMTSPYRNFGCVCGAGTCLTPKDYDACPARVRLSGPRNRRRWDAYRVNRICNWRRMPSLMRWKMPG